MLLLIAEYTVSIQSINLCAHEILFISVPSNILARGILRMLRSNNIREREPGSAMDRSDSSNRNCESHPRESSVFCKQLALLISFGTFNDAGCIHLQWTDAPMP